MPRSQTLPTAMPVAIPLIAVMLMAWCVAGCGRTEAPPPPPAPAAPPPDTYASAEDAGLSALLSRNLALVDRQQVDQAATKALLAEASRRRGMDLNGDGKPEWVLSIGTYRDSQGQTINLDGATGNRAWALLEQLPTGRWRVLLAHSGTDPIDLASRNHGWRDLFVGWQLGAGTGTRYFVRYDGDLYRPQWNTTLKGLGDGHFTPKPAAFDAALLRTLLGPRFAGTPGEITVLDGACFEDDLDGDGVPDLLMQINVVRADGQAVDLTSLSENTNFFYFTRGQNGWRLVLQLHSPGSLCMPSQLEGGGVQVYTHNAWPRPGNDWEHLVGWTVRRGQLVAGPTPIRP